MKTATVPGFIRLFYPSLFWSVSKAKKQIFITFDDGPHPEITPQVLQILDRNHAKATFFCVGENVKKYPETYRLILDKGHRTGNHSFNHLKGWEHDTASYVENVEKAAEWIDSNLFRPPYGKIKFNQIRQLRKKYYIIMWSVLTQDYDASLSREDCLALTLKHTCQGSVVVFHDSEKAKDKLLFVLPQLLESFRDRGYSFPVIPF